MKAAQLKLRQKLLVLLVSIGGAGLVLFALVLLLAERHLFHEVLPESQALRQVESRSALLIQNYYRFMLTPDLISTEVLDGDLVLIRQNLEDYRRLITGQLSKERLTANIRDSITRLEAAGKEMILARLAFSRIFSSQEQLEDDIDDVFRRYRGAISDDIGSSLDIQDQQRLVRELLPELRMVDRINQLFLQLFLEIREFQNSPGEVTIMEIEALKADISISNSTFELYTGNENNRAELAAQVLSVYQNVIATVDAFITVRRQADFAVSRAEQSGIDLNESIVEAITASESAGWQDLHESELLAGIVLLLTLLVGYILIYMGLNRILKPLEKLQSVISRLGEGDFKQRSKDVERSDEIGQLAAAFNRMADQLEDNVEQQDRFVEQLEEKNMELERFTYTVSHELKAPLVTVSGFLGLLKRDLDDDNRDKVDNDMEKISHAIEVMSKQLEDLLEISRIGRVSNPATSFSLTELCQEVMTMMQGLIEENQAQIEIDDNMTDIYADKARIREVIKNLVENGIKFASVGQRPHIRIKARRTPDKVMCRVEDNGPGIEPCYQERVFGLFDRLETGVPGTGVGLALVKRIVEIHKGDIWIESQGDGQGCCFCFTLPIPEGS